MSALITRLFIACLLTWLQVSSVPPAAAQTPSSPITSSGLNTIVTPNGNTYNITGGTRPGGGPNLFHSFGEFGIPTNNIANFLNLTPNLATSNILGRVTGGNISNIFGMIQTSGYGNANLFLINPAGFLFGPGATVNVGGMVTFASADYLRLADGGRFNASLKPVVPDLLTAAPVAAFGFLGSNPGAITVQGTQLTVADGTGISLVGVNITIQSGKLEDGSVQSARLSAPGGQINLVSAAGPGEVSAVTFSSIAGMTLGNINLSEDSLLDVSANSGGTIRIRAGQLVIADATLSADTVNANGASTAVDINVAGDVTISDSRALPAITAISNGTGNAGEVRIVSANLTATSSDPDFAPFAMIDTHSSGDGRAGNINITTGNLTVQNTVGPFPTWHFSDSGQQAGGPGGDTEIVAHGIDLSGTTLSTGTQLAELLGFEPSGPSGNLTLTGDSLHTDGAILISSASVTPSASHYGGNIRLNVRDITMLDTQVATDSFGGRGGITISGDSLLATNTVFSTFTAFGPGGGISFDGRVIELTNGSSFLTNTSGGAGANAGDIHVTATDHFSLIGNSGSNIQGGPAGLFTNSLGFVGTEGASGNVFVTTPRLVMHEGRISTSTSTSGGGGNVTVNAGVIEISGEFPNPDVGGPGFIGNIHPSGILTQTVGSEFCSGSCGNAGNISINTGSLAMANGSQIDSGTSSSGQGGNISVSATETIALSGTLSDGTPVGIFSRSIGTDPDSGSGGNITLNAGQSVTISDGAQVSASTTGPGNAGNVTIQGLASPAQSLTLSSGATITAQTLGDGDAGKISIVSGSLAIDGSMISADTFGEGNAGGIEVQAGSVALTGFGSIGSSAFAGSGNAGSVHITATDHVSLSNSAILSGSFSESPAAGNSGQVFISSPVIDLRSSSAIATSAIGHGNAGAITLQTNSLTMNFSEITSSVAGQGQGGTVSVLGLQGPRTKAQTITLASDSQILTETTNVDPLLPGEGAAGNIDLAADQLSLTNSKISAETRFSRGHAGNISIDTPSQVVIASNSEVSSRSTAGVDPAFQYGNAGSISVSTPSLAITEGGTITATTETNGAGGAIVLNVDALSISSGGRLTTGSVAGAEGLVPTGSAGNIDVSAQTVTLQDNSQISSSSTGTGTAGNVNISAGDQFAMSNSSVTTEANQSGGGIIKITTNPSGRVELTNSKISASVLDGTGGGGSVNIDPQFVILQNSQILAEAKQGPGGNIGITITNGGLFLPDSTSRVSASSEFGQSGNVIIQSPNAPAGGKIQPLGKAPLQVTALLSQRCAAIARGEVSSFVVAGRDTLPIEPGGWLTSPLASIPAEGGISVKAGVPAIATHSDGSLFVSLRRLPSPSKVAQLLSEADWISGCETS
ncbi:MAG: protein of unknown function [Nitrospira sp.]